MREIRPNKKKAIEYVVLCLLISSCASTNTNRDRSPASDLTCLQLLKNFYPLQTPKFLQERIAAAEDFHTFYRSFVPIFYEIISKQKSLLKLSSLEKYVSTMGGDVHVENFGFVLDDQAKFFLTVNDIDDTTQGKIYFDVLRHFVSGKIVSKDLTWKDYFEAYAKGIRNEGFFYSDSTKNYLENGLELTEAEMNKAVGKEPIKFLKKSELSRPLENKESLKLKEVLTAEYPGIEIFDEYVKLKKQGGSAGMLRYQVLVKLAPGEKVTWLDLKEMGASSYDKGLGSVSFPNFIARLTNIKKTLYQGKMNKSLGLITIDGRPFSVRPVDHFILSTKIEKLKDHEVSDFILDQAYTLGQMHGRSLDEKNLNKSTYVNDWENISNEDVEKVENDIKDNLKDLYKKSK